MFIITQEKAIGEERSPGMSLYRAFKIVEGFFSVIDGLVQVFSLGFYSSNLAGWLLLFYLKKAEGNIPRESGLKEVSEIWSELEDSMNSKKNKKDDSDQS